MERVMKKVTIIIPAYNAEKDINRCLTSVCGQTYSNIEVLIINDGSTDQTEKICQYYESQFEILKLINIDHQGVSAARNKGIKQATGDYFFFMDADDELLPFGIEYLMQYCTKGEWVIGNYQIVNIKKSSEPELHYQYFDEEVHFGDKRELPQLCISRNFNCVWGKLYRTDIIRRNALYFDEKRNYGEDLLFNLDYFQFVHKFVILKKAVYTYCYRFGEGLGTRFIKNEWKIQKELCEYMRRMSEDVYCLSAKQCDQMNHFYYAQAIAALQRIGDEKKLSLKQKRGEMKKITLSKFFLEILEKEYRLKRIGILDYLLLKNYMGWTYHIIHRYYVNLKRCIYREEKNGK